MRTTTRTLRAALLLLLATAPAARAGDGVWREPPPPARGLATMVHDRVLDRYVLVARDVWQTPAGADLPWSRVNAASDAPPNIQKALPSSADSARALFSTDKEFELWALALHSGDGWASLLPTQGGPVRRLQTAAVYQATKERVIVFGGRGPHPTFGVVNWNDLWEVDLSGTPVWHELHPAGTPPPAAGTLAPAALDEARDHMLIVRAGQLWALDLGDSLAWSTLPVTGVPDVNFNQFVIDPARDRLIAYGYRNVGSFLVFETWSVPLTGGVFTKIGDAGPVSFWPGLALDARNDRLVAYHEDATWVFPLNGGGWSRLGGTRTGLRERSFAFVVRDLQRPRWLVFDGMDELGSAGPPIQYEIDGSRGWQPYAATGPAPPPAIPASGFAFDSSRNQVICERGVTMHRLDLSTDTWTREDVANVPPGGRFKAWTVDEERDRLVVLGVATDSVFQQPYTAAWTIPLGAGPKAFTQLHPSGAAPAFALQPEDTPVAFTDVLRDRVVYLGTGTQVWALNFVAGGSSWQPLAGFPANLRTSTIGYDGAADRLFLFNSDLFNQSARLYEWALAQSPATARVIVPFGAPAPMPGHGWFSTFDPLARSFLMIGGTFGFLEDQVDSTVGAELVYANCESGPNVEPGDSAVVRVHLAGGSRGLALDVALACDRAWPGFPRAGKAWVAAGGATDLVESFAVPDTAAAGPVTFRFTGTPALQGCSSVFTVSGDGETPPGGLSLSLTPNPSHEGVTLRLGLDHDTDVRVEVRQLTTGRVVYARSLGRLDAGAYALPLLPQGAVPSGMYLVRTFVDGTPHDSKLVVLR